MVRRTFDGRRQLRVALVPPRRHQPEVVARQAETLRLTRTVARRAFRAVPRAVPRAVLRAVPRAEWRLEPDEEVEEGRRRADGRRNGRRCDGRRRVEEALDGGGDAMPLGGGEEPCDRRRRLPVARAPACRRAALPRRSSRRAGRAVAQLRAHARARRRPCVGLGVGGVLGDKPRTVGLDGGGHHER